MGQSCKGTCKKLMETVTQGGYYMEGKRFCKPCGGYIPPTFVWCPCCGYKTRGCPRDSKSRMVNKLKRELVLAT